MAPRLLDQFVQRHVAEEGFALLCVVAVPGANLGRADEGFFGKGEEGDGLLTAHGGEVGEELLERDAGDEVVHQRVDGHAGAGEDGASRS